ncbi:murein hydrolase activator EnvC family protein [Desulfobulbus alkaliphilus]|uniref:murein hydrolase activator EnvC family protein n=1 Tax=Desulfobulbus alkaliphilus TaxID=869814 RepID=UPI001963A8A6|nr:peptidoglycan DD-metalloendopeptidase family protein [Desulfobulbus alkaliphilus]MBM9536993.1 peptidoglycan DD-metalloendopeptidase family protein [Desulfobulbus alkaliphilus]
MPALLAIILFVLLVPPPVLMAVSQDPQAASISIGKLHQEIKAHQDLVDRSGQQERSLLDEIEHLDKKISALSERIEDLRIRIKTQEEVIAAGEQQLEEISRENEELLLHLMYRLQAFYLMGKTGFVDAAFSSRSLPELLVINDALHSLVTYDQEVFTAYRENMDTLQRVKRSQELEKMLLVQFLQDADQENNALQLAAEEKSELLHLVRTQKGLYQLALAEMKKAEKELSATLKRLETPQNQRVPVFSLAKGSLPPPVQGTLVNQFNQIVPGDEETTFANGLTISTPQGAEVIAIHDGVILFAGHMRGYGRIVIIDHDRQYYTVTARFDHIRVKEGDAVRQGQVIGTTGEMATLFGKGLYFEIRHGSVAVDPLDWLWPGAYRLQ